MRQQDSGVRAAVCLERLGRLLRTVQLGKNRIGAISEAMIDEA